MRLPLYEGDTGGSWLSLNRVWLSKPQNVHMVKSYAAGMGMGLGSSGEQEAELVTSDDALYLRKGLNVHRCVLKCE